MSLLNKNSLKKQLEFELYMAQRFPGLKYVRNKNIIEFFEKRQWETGVISVDDDVVGKLLSLGIDTIKGAEVVLSYAKRSCLNIDAKYVTFEGNVGNVNVCASKVIEMSFEKSIKISKKAKIDCNTIYITTHGAATFNRLKKLVVDGTLNPMKTLGLNCIDHGLVQVKCKNLCMKFSNLPRYKPYATDMYTDGWFSWIFS